MESPLEVAAPAEEGDPGDAGDAGDDAEEEEAMAAGEDTEAKENLLLTSIAGCMRSKSTI